MDCGVPFAHANAYRDGINKNFRQPWPRWVRARWRMEVTAAAMRRHPLALLVRLMGYAVGKIGIDDRLNVCAVNSSCGLFTDTEAGENAPQQVIGAKGPSDFAQGLLRHPQVFGEQFAGPGEGQLSMPMLEVSGSLAQRF
jgi:hypothetical protein